MPRALALLLGVVALLGVAWALFTPPWQAPDEPAHFGYVESLAQNHAVPGTQPGRVYSSAQLRSLQVSNGGDLSQLSDGRPLWSAPAAERYERRAGSLASGNGGGADPDGSANLARSNPPAFYALELVPYAAGSVFGSTTERLYLMRLMSVVLLLVTVAGSWLLVGELFGRDRLLQLAGAGVVGLLPMLTFISSSVTPDALLFAVWALVLWLGVRVLNRGLSLGSGVALGALVAVAVLTKATSYALVPPVLLCLVVGAWRRSGRRLPSWRVLAGVAVAAVPVLAWVLVSRSSSRPAINQVGSGGTGSAIADQGLNVGQLLSYLWQFYLPRLHSQQDFPTVQGVAVYDTWLKDLVGRFGWVQIAQPGWIYPVAAVGALVTIVAGVVGVARRATTTRWALAFLVLSALTLVVGLHAVDYRVGVQQGAPFMQGRYLLPLAALFAAIVAGAISLARERARLPLVAVSLGVMLALQVISFSRAAGYWYV